jgi:hypothetical protein
MRKCISLHRERVVLTGGMWTGEPRFESGTTTRRSSGCIGQRDDNCSSKRSPRPKYGDYGIKERQAAHLIGTVYSFLSSLNRFRNYWKRKPARVADRIAGEPVRWLAPATRSQFKQVARTTGRWIENIQLWVGSSKAIFDISFSVLLTRLPAHCVVAIYPLGCLLPLT